MIGHELEKNENKIKLWLDKILLETNVIFENKISDIKTESSQNVQILKQETE